MTGCQPQGDASTSPNKQPNNQANKPRNNQANKPRNNQANKPRNNQENNQANKPRNNQANNLANNKSKNEKNNSKKGSKLNNSVRKIKNTVLEKNLNVIKQYLPETPNLITNFQELDVPDNMVEISNFITSDMEKRFQEITHQNTMDVEKSELVVKRYNMAENKVETTNDGEFKLIKQFLEEGEFFNLQNNIDLVEASPLGMLILEGYRRYLKKENFITLNFHLLFQLCFQNKNTWYYADEIHQNLMVCYQELENQYLENIDERYNYLGCLVIAMIKSKKQVRLPIYLDKNSQIGFPSMRKIGKHYFTIFNISNEKDLFLDYDMESQEVSLVIDEVRDMVKYSLTQKGICFHQAFPDYLTPEYIEEIKAAENKFNSEENN